MSGWMKALEGAFRSRPGQFLAARAGLPEPAELRRGRTLPHGPIVLANLGTGPLVSDTLLRLGVTPAAAVIDTGDEPVPAYPGPIGALVIDATTLRTIGALAALREVLRPGVRAIEPSGRLVIVAAGPETVEGYEAGAVAQAIDGINRTVAKELRFGATANLLRVDPLTSPADLASTMSFLLEGRSAFVDGQAWSVSGTPPTIGGTDGPASAGLQGRIVVVTGAARGIGAAITAVLGREGARVVAVDVPGAGEALSRVANGVRGTALQLDITSPDAGLRIAAHVAERDGPEARLHGIVHNAGLTRDKLVINTDAARWASVLEVNLAAQIRINQVLLDPGRPGSLADGGRIIGVASTSGIAGNRGQANYAASKAGVVGLVRAMAPDLARRGITVNAVAPGFIETDMTARIPFLQREVFRRSNSLGQGGRPVDVAETIAWFLDPASAGVTGQVVRVCGQNLVGA